jgi:hypothetical protein
MFVQASVPLRPGDRPPVVPVSGKVDLDGIGKARLSVTCAGCETPMGTDAVTLKIQRGQNFKESVNSEGPGGGLFGDGRNLFLRQQ